MKVRIENNNLKRKFIVKKNKTFTKDHTKSVLILKKVFTKREN